MQRYFLNTPLVDERCYIEGEDTYHIKNVMRMQLGDRVICVGSDGHSAICGIAEIIDGSIAVDVLEMLEENTELPIQLPLRAGYRKETSLSW